MLTQLFWLFLVKVGQQFEFFKLTQIGCTFSKIMNFFGFAVLEGSTSAVCSGFAVPIKMANAFASASVIFLLGRKLVLLAVF